jgi:hypothetical protein
VIGPKVTNLPQSVHQRLLNKAKREGRRFNDVLQNYAAERFLKRLAASGYADRFVLKGALMLRVWGVPEPRPTMDIDLLGRMDPSSEAVARVLRECLQTEVEDDGLRFDGESLEVARITKDVDFPGIRARFLAYLGRACLTLQVDIGFGDAVEPDPRWVDYPVLLDGEPIRLLAYPPEAAIAEKYQAMVDLGTLNSRMKDFYDIWVLARVVAFNGGTLSRAIGATFARRGAAVPSSPPPALTAEFGHDATKQAQWAAFARRSQLGDAAGSLETVVGFLVEFLMPPSTSAATGQPFRASWPPGGPWQMDPGERE